MSPTEWDALVARVVADVQRYCPDNGLMPSSLVRYIHALYFRELLRYADPDGLVAQAIWAAMGRMGMVVAE